jgi:glycosyltransferase involved in cell wall biosynthesis
VAGNSRADCLATGGPAQHMSTQQALVCAPLLPDFDRESGSQRLVDLVEFLQSEGFTVTFIAHHRGRSERYGRALQQRGVTTYFGLNVQTRRVVAESQFQVAILAFWGIAEKWLPEIRKLSPATRIVVDTVDLHLLRNARMILQGHDERDGAGMLDSEYAADAIREINTYAAADAVLTVSAKEASFVNDFIGGRTRAFAVPDCEEIEASSVPFADREGILFIGNFRHPPNVKALQYLCNLVLPQLDSDLAAQHPVYIVGNALEHAGSAWRYSHALSHVRWVGWVPSVLPYLARARVSVLPLLYGAGTKRKMIQTLMMGTPAVSTSVGMEGLGLANGRHVLQADDPGAFARGISRLLQDAELWLHLADDGREHIRRTHSKPAARSAFRHVLRTLDERGPLSGDIAQSLKLHRRGFNHPYDQLTQRIQEIVRISVPLATTVLVVSRGDDDLLDLGGRKAWHFPRSADGNYAGHYPASGEDAIRHLEHLRSMGAEFLVFPATSMWWLDHYLDLNQHLQDQYRCVVAEPDTCLIFALTESAVESALALGGGENHATTLSLPVQSAPPQAEWANASTCERTEPHTVAGTGAASIHETAASAPMREEHSIDGQDSDGSGRWIAVDASLPELASNPALGEMVEAASGMRVLVIGIYLASQPNHARHIVETLAACTRTIVTQRWVALGSTPPPGPVAEVTVDIMLDRVPKYQIVNTLLEREDLSQYDYVIITDDDIRLAEGFVDYFIAAQRSLDFALAQPARTSESYIDFPIVEQQRGVIARETLLVEIGPLISVHASAYHSVFPFDLISPMGWGYESVWAYRLSHAGMKLGIIDAMPVDHSLRKPVVNYNWERANAGRTALLRKYPHYSLDKCFRVLNIITPVGVEA